MSKRKISNSTSRLDKRLPVEKYNELTRVYIETQNSTETAKRCGVSVNTIKKYLIDGDPERGLMPIIYRVQRANKMAQLKEDKALASAKVKYKGLVQAELAWITQTLVDTKFNHRDGLKEPYKGDIPQASDRLIRLLLLMLGDADKRVEVINSEVVTFVVGAVREIAGDELARRIGQRITERIEHDKQYAAGAADDQKEPDDAKKT